MQLFAHRSIHQAQTLSHQGRPQEAWTVINAFIAKKEAALPHKRCSRLDDAIFLRDHIFAPQCSTAARGPIALAPGAREPLRPIAEVAEDGGEASVSAASSQGSTGHSRPRAPAHVVADAQHSVALPHPAVRPRPGMYRHSSRSQPRLEQLSWVLPQPVAPSDPPQMRTRAQDHNRHLSTGSAMSGMSALSAEGAVLLPVQHARLATSARPTVRPFSRAE